MTVKDIRIRIGLKQTEFANRFQIPVRTIQNWEQGRVKEPSYLAPLLDEIATTIPRKVEHPYKNLYSIGDFADIISSLPDDFQPQYLRVNEERQVLLEKGTADEIDISIMESDKVTIPRILDRQSVKRGNENMENIISTLVSHNLPVEKN